MSDSSNPPIPLERTPILKWDGTVPAWGLFMICFAAGSTWVGYSWSTMQDLKDRMTVRETSATEYRKKVDTLEAQQRDVSALMGSMRSDLQVVKELMLRIEKRFEK